MPPWDHLPFVYNYFTGGKTSTPSPCPFSTFPYVNGTSGFITEKTRKEGIPLSLRADTGDLKTNDPSSPLRHRVPGG